jgi:hypothetical protein
MKAFTLASYLDSRKVVGEIERGASTPIALLFGLNSIPRYSAVGLTLRVSFDGLGEDCIDLTSISPETDVLRIESLLFGISLCPRTRSLIT